MVGSAVIRLLKKNNYKNLLVRSKEELNLENRSDVLIFLNYINQNMFFYVLQKLEEYTQIIHTFLNFYLKILIFKITYYLQQKLIK